MSLGSDDAIKVWFNGTEVAGEQSDRGVAPDQEKLVLQLKQGENTLLLKIVNHDQGSGFYFNPIGHNFPEAVVKLLGIPADQMNEAQQAELAAYYRSVAPLLDPVRKQLAEIEQQQKQRRR